MEATRTKRPFRQWPREDIIEAIRAWNSQYGAPPRQADWGRTGTAEQVARYDAGCWPAAETVGVRFGNFGNALRAAGFECKRGRPHRVLSEDELNTVARAYERLGSANAVGREMGCSPETIRRRLRAAGVTPHCGRLVHKLTAQAILDAIEDWHRLYGQTPHRLDWALADAKRRGHHDRVRRHEEHPGRWPTLSQVRAQFGSFKYALVQYRLRRLERHLAGEPSQDVHRLVRQRDILYDYLTLGSYAQVARKLGVSGPSIHYWVSADLLPPPTEEAAPAAPAEENTPELQRARVLEAFEGWHELTGALPTRADLALTTVADHDLDALFGSYNDTCRAWFASKGQQQLLPAGDTRRADPAQVAADLRAQRGSWEQVGEHLGLTREAARVHFAEHAA